jgi:hypothetical protein
MNYPFIKVYTYISGIQCLMRRTHCVDRVDCDLFKRGFLFKFKRSLVIDLNNDTRIMINTRQNQNITVFTVIFL